MPASAPPTPPFPRPDLQRISSVPGFCLWLFSCLGLLLAGEGEQVFLGLGVNLTEAGPHTMAGTVDVSEMMGSEVHLHVNADGKDVILVIPTTDLPAAWRGGIPYTCWGVPICWMKPSFIMTMRSPRVMASVWSWVT